MVKQMISRHFTGNNSIIVGLGPLGSLALQLKFSKRDFHFMPRDRNSVARVTATADNHTWTELLDMPICGC